MYGGKLIWLAYSWNEIYRFCFVLLRIWRQFPSTSLGALIFGGAIKRRDFCVTSRGGLYWGGFFSEFYGSFYLATILSQQKSEKWYIIHLIEAVVIPLAYCLVLPIFVWDRWSQPFSLMSFSFYCFRLFFRFICLLTRVRCYLSRLFFFRDLECFLACLFKF